MLPDKGLAVGRDIYAVGVFRSLPHSTACHQVDRAPHVHHHLFAGAHKHVDRLAVVEAAPPALGAEDGVHLLLPARFPRVALGARAFAGTQPERLVVDVRQRQVAQGELGAAHVARLEGAGLQDPLMLDAAPLPPGPDIDPLGANEGSVWPPHVDVFQRLPGPIGRHPQAERHAPRAVQLHSGRLRPLLGGGDALIGVSSDFIGVSSDCFGVSSDFFGVSSDFFGPPVKFGLQPLLELLLQLSSDLGLHLSLGGAGEAARGAAAAPAADGRRRRRSCRAVCAPAAGRACRPSLTPFGELSGAPHRVSKR